MRNDKVFRRKWFGLNEALSRCFLEQTAEIQDKRHSGSPMTELRFEPRINLER